MKYLGIDFGTKRVGLAVSDDEGRIAFPKKVLLNNKNLLKELLSFIKDENIQKIIVGDSKDLSGKENIISSLIEDFILQIKQNISLPVEKEKEFFSSYEAHGRMGKGSLVDRKQNFKKTEDLDAKSAMIILQRYLDRINNLK